LSGIEPAIIRSTRGEVTSTIGTKDDGDEGEGEDPIRDRYQGDDKTVRGDRRLRVIVLIRRIDRRRGITSTRENPEDTRGYHRD
jgi:hypothetical protein